MGFATAFRMRKPIALLALLAGACAQTPANKQSAALSESWLVGAWVPEGENCASDAGLDWKTSRHACSPSGVLAGGKPNSYRDEAIGSQGSTP